MVNQLFHRILLFVYRTLWALKFLIFLSVFALFHMLYHVVIIIIRIIKMMIDILLLFNFLFFLDFLLPFSQLYFRIFFNCFNWFDLFFSTIMNKSELLYYPFSQVFVERLLFAYFMIIWASSEINKHIIFNFSLMLFLIRIQADFTKHFFALITLLGVYRYVFTKQTFRNLFESTFWINIFHFQGKLLQIA